MCKLQRVQINAAWVITLTEKHDHITPILKEQHWLPVRKRVEFKILLLAYKCLHGTAPSYLRELLEEYVPPRTLRSMSKNLLCKPNTNMKPYSDKLSSAFAQLNIHLTDPGENKILKYIYNCMLLNDGSIALLPCKVNCD